MVSGGLLLRLPYSAKFAMGDTPYFNRYHVFLCAKVVKKVETCKEISTFNTILTIKDYPHIHILLFRSQQSL